MDWRLVPRFCPGQLAGTWSPGCRDTSGALARGARVDSWEPYLDEDLARFSDTGPRRHGGTEADRVRR